MTDIYKPRFMNELASTGNPIVDAEMRSFKQNTTHLNVGTTQQDGASAFSGCSQTSRDGLGDSCERSMGDAAIGNDVERKCNSSPTYTREELVEVMLNVAWGHTLSGSINSALDALIALGAVRVK